MAGRFSSIQSISSTGGAIADSGRVLDFHAHRDLAYPGRGISGRRVRPATGAMLGGGVLVVLRAGRWIRMPAPCRCFISAAGSRASAAAAIYGDLRRYGGEVVSRPARPCGGPYRCGIWCWRRAHRHSHSHVIDTYGYESAFLGSDSSKAGLCFFCPGFCGHRPRELSRRVAPKSTQSARGFTPKEVLMTARCSTLLYLMFVLIAGQRPPWRPPKSRRLRTTSSWDKIPVFFRGRRC